MAISSNVLHHNQNSKRPINDIQKGILGVCGDAGYELVVHACHIESYGLIDVVMRFVNRAKLDGVIILPAVSELGDVAETLDKAGCRYVQFTSELGVEPWKLVAQIDQGPDAARSFETMVSPQFVPRESTGPAPS